MFLTALSDAVLAGPRLSQTVADAAQVPWLNLTAPAALRPFLVDGLVRAGQPVLLVTATGRESKELADEIRALVDPLARAC